jgi:hypothetical protein
MPKLYQRGSPLRTAARLAAAGLLIAAPALVNAQAADVRAEIRTTYAFDPAKLSRVEQAKKAQSLDAFWKKVRAAPDRYLPALRAEVQNPTATSTLACDGAMLLLSANPNEADRAIGLAGLRRCELYEMQHTGFFFGVHQLAGHAVDVSDLALRVLKRDDIAVFALPNKPPFGQDFALIFMLAPLDDALYLDKAIKLLDSPQPPLAQQSLLKLAWYSATLAGDKTVERIAADSKRPPALRDLAAQLAAAGRGAQRALSAGESKRVYGIAGAKESDDYAALKQLRRERMKNLTPSSLEAFDALTFLLRRTR